MREHILVVDDDPHMLIAVSETLRRSGYSVTMTGSAIEALCRFRNGRFPLVITDLRMPEMGGLDLLKKLKTISPQTRVILLTAYGTVQNAVDAMKQGAFDYLLKPFSSDALEAVVRRALGPSGTRDDRQEIVTEDPEFLRILESARQAASSPATILIEAESGTGKELLARMIHRSSPRASGPFVAVNCAALPENLLESELFGFEKGAFTGAGTSKPGKFELAHRGTLLLDEIGEMAPILQAKLLRVLQEREVDRIGGTEPVKIDVRVIATTNRDLAGLVSSGNFREDLYYRLRVVCLSIPPLRHRVADVALLAEHFCRRYGKEFGRGGICCSPSALERLALHHWPGNVRELENTIQRAVALSSGPEIRLADLFLDQVGRSYDKTMGRPEGIVSGTTVRDMERQLIQKTLAGTHGNRTHAARLLGISLRTLRNKLNEFGLQDRGAKVAQSSVHS